MKEMTKRESTLSTYIVMGCTLASRLLGFVRIAILGAIFGGGSTSDVIFTVFRIPNSMRKLLAEGALSSAYIPELSRQLVEDKSGEKARLLLSNILALLLLIVIPLTLLFIIFPGTAINILSEFEDPSQTALAVRLLPYMITYIFWVSISALFMGILNSHNRFFIPAITPVFFSIAVISSLLLFHKSLGPFAMALGVIVGGIGQILIQIKPVRRLGYSLKPDFNFKSEEFRRVMVRWLPILISSSLFSVNQFIAGIFATMLEEGSVTAMEFAVTFWQLPFGLFVNSIITVTYPKMSRQAASGDFEGLRDTLYYGWKGLIAMLLPSSAVFMVIGAPIIAIAMQRGAYTLSNTLLAGQVLFAYSTGLLFVGAYNFTQRAFYTLGDMISPIKTSLLVVAVDIILTMVFLFVAHMGITGLAYANSLAYLFGIILYILQLRKKVDLSGMKELLMGLIKVILALLPGILWLFGLNLLWGDQWWTQGSSFRGFAVLALYGLGFIGIVLFFYRLLKVEFLSIIGRRS
jgi:putative peptidoglycan lipid II flippase